MQTCVVSVSGGAASAVAWERAIERFDGDVVAVFANTKCEDADLYRFLDDVESYLNHEVIRIAEGRSVWELFFDEKMMGSPRVDLCSRILKRELINNWIADKYPADTTVRAFGFGVKEMDRSHRLKARLYPYRVWCPLQEKPYMGRCDILDRIQNVWDVDPPRLYEQGFEHNNCGGACVKGGHGSWHLLYRKRPEVYEEWENNEQRFREMVGKDVSILRDRRGGKLTPLTLADLRQQFAEGYRPTDTGSACDCMGLSLF